MKCQSILVALDTDEHAGTVLAKGLELAAIASATLQVLHVEEGKEGRFSAPALSREHEAKEKAFARLKPILEAQGVCPSQLSIRFGRAAELVAEFAASHGIDLLVCGSCGNIGVRKMVVGATTGQLLNHAQCDVYIVHVGEQA